ncbi:MAG: ATP-dependent DNA helicase [Verrucomicrobia bacterium]|nr:ATP-dependent DNA helicase [Verrucomicrobiota bacterium]
MISTFDTQAAGAELELPVEIERIFSKDGLLSGARNFEYRPQQQEMAVAIAGALQSVDALMVEAGTGVGKSLAYLIPSILYAVRNRKRAVVSTNTINLQEQLVYKDLPMLKEILPVDFKYTMLKGRQNYLCTRRLARAMEQADALFTSSEIEELKRIYEWSKTTNDGSLSDFEVEPNPKVWQMVCSERGICSPKQCGPQSDFAKEHAPCFFQLARSRFMSADVLVLNHTLFFLNIDEEDEVKPGGILFKNDFVIFDEAHTLENVASRHIGLSVSVGQIKYNLQRLWNPKTQKGLVTQLFEPKLVELITNLFEAAELFFSQVEAECDRIHRENTQGRQGAFTKAYARKNGWNEVRIRRPDFVPDTLTGLIRKLREEIAKLIKSSDKKDINEELSEMNRRLTELCEGITTFLEQSAEAHVFWVERAGKDRKNITLCAAPIRIDEFFRRRIFGAGTSVILTSATLATKTGKSASPSSYTPQRKGVGAPTLDYAAGRLGAEAAVKLQVGSPFDYAGQMTLYVASKMPDPRHGDYEKALAYWIKHFVRMTHGKAFVLFTSYRTMLKVAEDLTPFFNDELGVECYVQGTGLPRSMMLENFRCDTDSVLFGTESFWQGVDVPGASLSNVIITRLPFAVPDHPLIEARMEYIEEHGGNAFFDFSVPEAILKLRQGVGRLIRSNNDKGIVVILDNRVITKRYGRLFMDSLPGSRVEIL